MATSQRESALVEFVRHNQAAIARHIGKTPQAVGYWLKRGQIPPHREAEVRDFVLARYAQMRALIVEMESGEPDEPPWAKFGRQLESIDRRLGHISEGIDALGGPGGKATGDPS